MRFAKNVTQRLVSPLLAMLLAAGFAAGIVHSYSTQSDARAVWVKVDGR